MAPRPACDLPGAADTAAFVTYLAEVLYPTLRRGDIVVMDNLAVHKSPQVAALIEAVGAEVRFLPAYSSDFNPIEKMWSKIKACLRSTEARTPEELDQAINLAFSKITAKDAAGYFASCGYSIILNALINCYKSCCCAPSITMTMCPILLTSIRLSNTM